MICLLSHCSTLAIAKLLRLNKSIILNLTQTTFYIPNHMVMTQWNTCTYMYINELTSNYNCIDKRKHKSYLGLLFRTLTK